MGIANFSSFKSLFLYYFNFEESIHPLRGEAWFLLIKKFLKGWVYKLRMHYCPIVIKI